MYLVQSFDFGGSSDVAVHALTSVMEDAERAYAAVLARHAAYNAKSPVTGAKRLVERVEVPEGYSCVEGFKLYWGWDRNGAASGPRVLRTNNRDEADVHAAMEALFPVADR